MLREEHLSRTEIYGKLVTNREEVLKVWEGHYSELLNHEGI